MKLDMQELSPQAVAIVDAELKQFKKEDSEEKRVFLAAFALVKNKETWCQGTYFKTFAGTGCELNYAYCSIGALEKVSDRNVYIVSHIYNILSRAARRPIDEFNDQNPHHVVVELWERVGRENGWLA